MSSRFAPLSYERPKGLLVVKGEVLIERQIHQLQEAGIDDITIVVGYMKEQFFYLQDKFNVNIVVNEDYYRYNNTSSLIRVLDKIDETYICSSDNYFSENVFMENIGEAYYASLYVEGPTDEYCLTPDEEDMIMNVTIGGYDAWYMIGHVYFDHAFSETFKQILLDEYENYSTSREELWENLYMRHLDVLKMKIKRYSADSIHEFDSLDDLRAFDTSYINNSDSLIMKNICLYLQCAQKDIVHCFPLTSGMTNNSFGFLCKKDGRRYVYRKPGAGTETYINRQSEWCSMQYANQLGLDDSFVYMDEKEGWKLSYYIEDAQWMDYHKWDEVERALSMMRKLHESKITSKYNFGLWDKTFDYWSKLGNYGRNEYADMSQMHENMSKLWEKVKQEGVENVLCHCDGFDRNFLIDKNDKMYLIDWEYSGNDDPALDVTTFICCSDYTDEEADRAIRLYFGHEPTLNEWRHQYAYLAIGSWHWFLWSLFSKKNAIDVGDYPSLYYSMAKNYYLKAKKLYD